MTGLDGIRVNHAALDQAAADMYSTVKAMDERIDRMERELEPLRSDWTGQAQHQYTVSKATWDRAIGEMRDLLDESHRTVYQSNADYAEADRRGAGLFDF